MRTPASLSPRLLLLVALSACGQAAGPSSVDDLDASVVPDDLRVRHDLARDLTAPPSVSIKGVAVDEDGNPIPGIWMSVCNPFGCRSDNAGPDGAFVLHDLEMVSFGVRSHDDITAEPLRGSVVQLILPTTPGVVLDVGVLHVPRFPVAAAVARSGAAPESLGLGDGVTLRFVRDDLVFPLGDPEDKLAARRVPLAKVPRFDLGGEELLGAVAFLPYSTTSKTPLGLTVPLALPAGTAVKFRAVYEFEGKLGAPVPGHAAGDGLSVSTDPGVGLDNLTWVLISR